MLRPALAALVLALLPACGPVDDTRSLEDLTCECACSGRAWTYRGMAHDRGVVCDCEGVTMPEIVRPGAQCFAGP